MRIGWLRIAMIVLLEVDGITAKHNRTCRDMTSIISAALKKLAHGWAHGNGRC